MRAYCCQQWVGQLYYDCIQIQMISWCLTPSLPPFLPSPGEVVQVQSQGHFPTPKAHFQSPSLRWILLPPSCQHSCLYLTKYRFWLKAAGNGGCKYQPPPSPLAWCACPCPLLPKSAERQGRIRYRDCNCFSVMTCQLLWSPCPGLPGGVAPLCCEAHFSLLS